MAPDVLRQSELLAGASQIFDTRTGAIQSFVGLDASQVLTHLCVVGPDGRQVCRGKCSTACTTPTQPEYIDKNYGGILIIWDRPFGNYQSEGETPVYGLTEQINSASPIDVHFAEARRFAAGFRRLKTWKNRIDDMLDGPEVRARD